MGHMIGPRVTLREYRREDFPCIRAWANDTAVTRFLSHIFLPPQTHSMTEDFLERVVSGRNNDYNFVIADRETLAYIGQVDLFGIHSVNRTAELGVVIGEDGKRGQGIGTEAITLMLEFAFLRANMHRVELWVNSDNARAIRCYEKCGFQHEGRRRQAHFAGGAHMDLLLMGALRAEWLAEHEGRLLTQNP